MGEEMTSESQSYNKYALSGKIMLSAIIILFTVILLVVCLHIYSRWYLARYRRQRQQLRNARRRGPHIIFISDLSTATNANANALSHGLEPSILNSLPTFVYSPTTHTQECAVCLSEFQENEKGRLLPKCSHSFHIECIDMWFASHSTCPLCRSPVVGSDTPNQIQIVVDPPNQIDTNTSAAATPSSSSRNLSIEVPRRNESFKSLEDEVQESPLRGFKSPGGRMRSLKRILSRDTRPPTPLSCGSEIDLERGGGEPSARPNES